jgi:hypothetical protein
MITLTLTANKQGRNEDQYTPTQTSEVEDAVRSICGGERCTYALNSGVDTQT